MRAVISLCLLVVVRAAPVEDEVTLPLPGLSIRLPWKHYSGYLNGTGDRKLHYWFIQSANPEPQYDPLVLWLNGGPGCSSMVGLLLEHGPFKLNDDGANLEINPFSWNKAPAGVGYSYAESPIIEYTDSMVAKDNYKALRHFFMKFPEYKGNEFFIAGESYGGFYVPTLSELVLNDMSINFKGFAVGNAVMDWDWIYTSIFYFLYNHGAIIGEREWTDLHKRCCTGGSFLRCNLNTSDSCGDMLSSIWRKTTKLGLSIYNLYQKCSRSKSLFGSKYDDNTFFTQEGLVRKLKGGYPCFDTTFLDTYMNDFRLREALHIPDRLGAWKTCSSLDYQMLNRNVFNEFRFAINNQKRILVYNGDVDPLVSYQSNQWFIDDLDIKETQPYTAWGLQDETGNIQNAGFWRGYNNLKFVTIKGAGHKSPRDKPREALHVFRSFIKDTPL